jgi:hypothetical protein
MEKCSSKNHSSGAKEIKEVNKGGRPAIVLTDEQIAQTEALVEEKQ